MTKEEYDNLKVDDHILWSAEHNKVWVAIVTSVKLYKSNARSIRMKCIYSTYQSYSREFDFTKSRCEEFKLLTEEESSFYYKLMVFE